MLMVGVVVPDTLRGAPPTATLATAPVLPGRTQAEPS